MRFRRMSVECQANVKSQSELDIGGRETCYNCSYGIMVTYKNWIRSFQNKTCVKDPSVVTQKNED